MKKLLLAFFILLSVAAYSQSMILRSEKYPDADTAACLFLEVVNDSAVQWQHGFVVIFGGHISFGNTFVARMYLPFTSGVVTSQLFYKSMRPIKNYAIQVIIKPVGKPKTTISGKFPY